MFGDPNSDGEMGRVGQRTVILLIAVKRPATLEASHVACAGPHGVRTVHPV